MLRALFGMVLGATDDEQRALVVECRRHLADIFEAMGIEDTGEPAPAWMISAPPPLGPLVVMRDRVERFAAKLYLNRPLSRADVGLLRQWRHDLGVAKEKVKSATPLPGYERSA